jgi:hypothetical protein
MVNSVHFIGHSHGEAVVHGCARRNLDVAWTTIIASGDQGITVERDGEHHLNDATLALIEGKKVDQETLISVVAGNCSNFVGIMAWIPPFDFYYPGFLDAVSEGAEIIPFDTVKKRFDGFLEIGDIRMLRALLNDVPRVRAHIQSPPPLRDNGLIRAKLDPYFRETYPHAEVADPFLRLKLWKLQSDKFEAVCNEYGIGFITAPPSAVDDDGFLKPEFCAHNSSTHANYEYGDLVVQQIVEAM